MISEIRTYYNAKCLECGKVEEEMLITGALIFCVNCFPFKSNHPAKEERELYLKYLHKRNSDLGE